MSRPARERLEAVLEAEERLYREMRELLQKERALIVALDAPGLTEVALEKEALASEGRMLERSRLEVTEELARELGLPTPRPTLRHLGRLLQERPLYQPGRLAEGPAATGRLLRRTA